jgi:hypothetical protein
MLLDSEVTGSVQQQAWGLLLEQVLVNFFSYP